MAYVYLAIAILFEVLGTVAMKYSVGFTKVLPSVLTVASNGICFIALAAALKSLPIGNVYAIWAGVGTALMVLLGAIFFNESMPIQKVLATSMIIFGVVLLNVNSDKGTIRKAEQIANSEAELIPVAFHVDSIQPDVIEFIDERVN